MIRTTQEQLIKTGGADTAILYAEPKVYSHEVQLSRRLVSIYYYYKIGDFKYEVDLAYDVVPGVIVIDTDVDVETEQTLLTLLNANTAFEWEIAS